MLKSNTVNCSSSCSLCKVVVVAAIMMMMRGSTFLSYSNGRVERYFSDIFSRAIFEFFPKTTAIASSNKMCWSYVNQIFNELPVRTLFFFKFIQIYICLDHVQLKVNCRPKVNCRIKFGLARPTVGWPAQICPYNSLLVCLQFTFNCNSLVHDLALIVGSDITRGSKTALSTAL